MEEQAEMYNIVDDGEVSEISNSREMIHDIETDEESVKRSRKRNRNIDEGNTESSILDEIVNDDDSDDDNSSDDGDLESFIDNNDETKEKDDL